MDSLKQKMQHCVSHQPTRQPAALVRATVFRDQELGKFKWPKVYQIFQLISFTHCVKDQKYSLRNTEHPERWHLWLICHKENVNWLRSQKNAYEIKIALGCPTAPSKHQGKIGPKFCHLRKTMIPNLTFVSVNYTKTLFKSYATVSPILQCYSYIYTPQ